ncbi:hypothetical protein E3P99_01660 [Wallemia hederae]|uniref:RRM domain-containing protein n=1 Tax=Wallemia hederae TaxID=1540922 RepID=A0A4V4LTH6_9BASI|nr:hypothetical protein E3P99_01660 [Wallemia hederae]
MGDAEDIDIYGDDIGGGNVDSSGQGGDIYGDLGTVKAEDAYSDDISQSLQSHVKEEKPQGEVLPTVITSTPVFRTEALPYNYKPQAALMFNELHWYTKDEDLMAALDHLGYRIRYQDIAFAEHKVNGKSKGTAYVEVPSREAADVIKRWFDSHDFQDKRMQVQHTQCVNGNPFKTIPKENSGKNANLAYQNQQLSRGSYRPRGSSRPPPSHHSKPPGMMGMPNMMGMPMNPAVMQQMMMGGRPPLPHMGSSGGPPMGHRSPPAEDPRLAKRSRQN